MFTTSGEYTTILELVQGALGYMCMVSPSPPCYGLLVCLANVHLTIPWCSSVPYHTLQHHTILLNTILCINIPCQTMAQHSIANHTILNFSTAGMVCWAHVHHHPHAEPRNNMLYKLHAALLGNIVLCHAWDHYGEKLSLYHRLLLCVQYQYAEARCQIQCLWHSMYSSSILFSILWHIPLYELLQNFKQPELCQFLIDQLASWPGMAAPAPAADPWCQVRPGVPG